MCAPWPNEQRETLSGRLKPVWLMDEDDPYPGEWALGEPGMLAVNGKLQSAGIGWIASGDVTPEEA